MNIHRIKLCCHCNEKGCVIWIHTPLKAGENGELSNLETGKCNNFNYRFKKTGPKEKDRLYGEADPIYIMQHHTVRSFQGTAGMFTKEGGPPVSAHYVIDKDGAIYHYGTIYI